MSFRSCAALLLGYLCTSSAMVAYPPPLFGPSVVSAAAAAMVAEPAPLAAIVALPPAPASTPVPRPAVPVVEPASVPPMAVAMNAVVVPVQPPPALPPPPRISATRSDIDALMAEMRSTLGGTVLPDAPPLTRAALSAATAMMQKAGVAPDTLQVILVVDRSPKVQRLWVTVATPGSNVLATLGSVHVSTGKPGRKEHFRTPVGVFLNDAAILGYRAQGTYNENHIRGIGLRGMRVWDFGWQTTDDWRTPRALMAVRMEMHATDPSVLEPRLGRWDSEGCIRIPTRFNSFLDQTGLIDAKEREAARQDRRFAALLPKHTVPSPLAGQTLVVVDTSDPNAAPSDRVRAQLIAHPNTSGPEHDDAS